MSPFDCATAICGRALGTPVAGSAFEDGHKPRLGFLRALQVNSPFCTPLFSVPVDDVLEVEDCDEREEEELDRWALLRGTNILETSSALMPLTSGCPLPAPAHPPRARGGKLCADATAVICGRMKRR